MSTADDKPRTPLLEINTRFLRPATYGESLQIHTDVTEWRSKTFVMRHTVMRGDTVLCEGSEIRAFCKRDGEKLYAVPIPPDIRAKCETFLVPAAAAPDGPKTTRPNPAPHAPE